MGETAAYLVKTFLDLSFEGILNEGVFKRGTETICISVLYERRRDVIKQAAIAIPLFAVLGITTHAQVLTTAETLGKRKSAVLFSENRLFVDGVQLNIAYLQYVRGISKDFDFYASIGGTRIFKQDQAWIGVGGNYRLFRIEKVNVSFFNVFSMPLHRRREASTVLLNSAVVMSRSITPRIALYSGLNSLWPIGARERGLFTPPTKKINVAIGAAIFLGNWVIFPEVDIGRLTAAGVGIARSF